MKHLLISASVSDASKVLRSDEMSRANNHYLYSWMVKNCVEDAHPFKTFALAFRDSDDIFLEQNFASRALERHRKAASDGGSRLELADEDAAEEEL